MLSRLAWAEFQFEDAVLVWHLLQWLASHQGSSQKATWNGMHPSAVLASAEKAEDLSPPAHKVACKMGHAKKNSCACHAPRPLPVPPKTSGLKQHKLPRSSSYRFGCFSVAQDKRWIKQCKLAKGVLLIKEMISCEFCPRVPVCSVLHLLFCVLEREGCRCIFRVEK